MTSANEKFIKDVAQGYFVVSEFGLGHKNKTNPNLGKTVQDILTLKPSERTSEQVTELEDSQQSALSMMRQFEEFDKDRFDTKRVLTHLTGAKSDVKPIKIGTPAFLVYKYQQNEQGEYVAEQTQHGFKSFDELEKAVNDGVFDDETTQKKAMMTFITPSNVFMGALSSEFARAPDSKGTSVSAKRFHAVFDNTIDLAYLQGSNLNDDIKQNITEGNHRYDYHKQQEVVGQFLDHMSATQKRFPNLVHWQTLYGGMRANAQIPMHAHRHDNDKRDDMVFEQEQRQKVILENTKQLLMDTHVATTNSDGSPRSYEQRGKFMPIVHLSDTDNIRKDYAEGRQGHIAEQLFGKEHGVDELLSRVFHRLAGEGQFPVLAHLSQTGNDPSHFLKQASRSNAPNTFIDDNGRQQPIYRFTSNQNFDRNHNRNALHLGMQYAKDGVKARQQGNNTHIPTNYNEVSFIKLAMNLGDLHTSYTQSKDFVNSLNNAHNGLNEHHNRLINSYSMQQTGRTFTMGNNENSELDSLTLPERDDQKIITSDMSKADLASVAVITGNKQLAELLSDSGRDFYTSVGLGLKEHPLQKELERTYRNKYADKGLAVYDDRGNPTVAFDDDEQVAFEKEMARLYKNRKNVDEVKAMGYEQSHALQMETLRDNAKATVNGLNYDGSVSQLSHNIKSTQKEAQTVYQSYHDSMPKLKEYYHMHDELLKWNVDRFHQQDKNGQQGKADSVEWVGVIGLPPNKDGKLGILDWQDGDYATILAQHNEQFDDSKGIDNQGLNYVPAIIYYQAQQDGSYVLDENGNRMVQDKYKNTKAMFATTFNKDEKGSISVETITPNGHTMVYHGVEYNRGRTQSGSPKFNYTDGAGNRKSNGSGSVLFQNLAQSLTETMQREKKGLILENGLSMVTSVHDSTSVLVNDNEVVAGYDKMKNIMSGLGHTIANGLQAPFTPNSVVGSEVQISRNFGDLTADSLDINQILHEKEKEYNNAYKMIQELFVNEFDEPTPNDEPQVEQQPQMG